jgi:hypothetical protein
MNECPLVLCAATMIVGNFFWTTIGGLGLQVSFPWSVAQNVVWFD